MFAENNNERAMFFSNIYTKRKESRKFLPCITFLGSFKLFWDRSDWFKLHRIAENFYSA